MNNISRLGVTDRAVCSQCRLDIIIYYCFFFILSKKSFYNKIQILHNFQKIKLENHSEELALLKPSYILVASTRSVKYPLAFTL